MHLSRFLLFSIAGALCHPLCAVSGGEVQMQSTLAATSGTCLLPASAAPLFPLPAIKTSPQRGATTPNPVSGDLVRISADRQEKEGRVFHLRGNVEITY